MAALQAEIKRGVLRTLFRQSQTDVVKLSDSLARFQDSGFDGIKSGRLVITSAGFGRSVGFAPPASWQQFTQEQIFSLSEELLATYDTAKSNLAASGNASPTDQQIFDSMMADDRLQTVTSVQKDWSTINWPSRM
jgi:hypothetical protein